MFRSSLVTALLISSVCAFANADGTTVNNSLLPIASSSKLTPLSMDSSQEIGAEASDVQTITVQAVAGLEETPATAISADDIAVKQVGHELNVMPQYVPSSGGGGLSFPFALFFEVLASGLLLAGALVLFFRFAASVVHG
jgi:hypothetical protein